MKHELSRMTLILILSLYGLLLSPSIQGVSFQISSPWTWVCQNQTCIKEMKEVADGTAMSFARCKLTCSNTSMIWPKPTGALHMSSNALPFLASNLQFTQLMAPNDASRALLQEASDLFLSLVKNMIPADASSNGYRSKLYKADAQLVNIEVAFTSNATYSTMAIDESYKLAVNTSASTTSVFIVATTFFGARHALETLSQLIVWDSDLSSLIMISDASIQDSPVYPHRGIMVDTSRNFMSVDMLKKIIDGMGYNKLNVFHWHFADSSSFPFVSNREPFMALYGAFSADKVYTADDIRDLVHYATVRGVKIVPEIDGPSHAGAGWEWGPQKGRGDLVLCYGKQPWDTYCYEPPCGQFNPINPNVYQIIGNLYKDMSELFPTDIFHMGGDEVKFACWNETTDIVDWLRNNSRGQDDDGFLYLWNYFQNETLRVLDDAYGKQLPVMMWTNKISESMKIENYLDKNRYILHVWTTVSEKADVAQLKDVYKKGYKLIFTNNDNWYLDCGAGSWVGEGNHTNMWCSPFKGWQTVYDNNLRLVIANFSLAYNHDQILGGEAAIWAEQTLNNVLESKIWPRGAALAERLWSDPDTPALQAYARLLHHRKRLESRGITTDGMQPEWCYQNEGGCQ